MAGNERWITGCGSVNVDLIYSGLDRLPDEGAEVYATDFALRFGGGIPGTLVNLSRLGVPVKLQTLLGSDLFADFARDFLAREKVCCEALKPGREGQRLLNLTTALLTPRDRTMVSYAGPLRLDDALLEGIYQSSRGAAICLMDQRFLPVYRDLKADGVLLALDFGWEEDLTLAKCRPWLELADYFTPNRKEALKITGASDPYEAARILSDYIESPVIKLDREGCLLYEKGRFSLIPAVPGIVCLDSTGAGDAFFAGFLYGIYKGYSLAEAVSFGNITGGRCVTAVGCLTAFCTEADLLGQAQHLRQGQQVEVDGGL